MFSTTVSIPGIHCASCASLIKEVSAEFTAVVKVDVDLATKIVTLEHGDNFNIAQWKQTIEALGSSYQITSNK